jgi:imidazolonepropionase-like amidohydrolase
MMSEEKKITAITSGRLIDGTGADPVENATVIIEGSTIKEVGKGLNVPKSATVLDAGGKTVMPGIINAHLHLAGGASGTGPSPYRPREVQMFKAADDARQNLASGITTVKDCAGRNAPFLKQAVREGVITGLPRIIAACCALTRTGGPLDGPPSAWKSRDARENDEAEALVCDGVDECIKATRYTQRLGADFIKVFASLNFFHPGATTKSGIVFNFEELEAIVKTAGKVGKYVTVHSQNVYTSKDCVLAGIKTIDHGSRSDEEVVTLGKERGTIFVSTLAYLRVMLDERPPGAAAMIQEEWDRSVESYTMMHDLGAVMAAGTDSFGDAREGAMEIELLNKYCGFTPMEAIVAATKRGAEACFIGDMTGTLETGKAADIIVVDGDPLADLKVLQDIEKIKIVMLEGNVCIDRGL